MAVQQDTVIVVKSSTFGEGEPDLGEKLINSFFKMLLETDKCPARILFLNSGIFLTTEGSPVIEVLKTIEKEGTEFFSCGTCLDYYGRKDKLLIGQPTNMKDTVEALYRYDRIIDV